MRRRCRGKLWKILKWGGKKITGQLFKAWSLQGLPIPVGGACFYLYLKSLLFIFIYIDIYILYIFYIFIYVLILVYIFIFIYICFYLYLKSYFVGK